MNKQNEGQTLGRMFTSEHFIENEIILTEALGLSALSYDSEKGHKSY